VSYGNQLNIFKAQANRYGPDWRAIIVCSNRDELHIAADDARETLGGRYSPAGQTLHLPNGSTLIFRVVTCWMEAERVFSGREFTQIAWLHYPSDKRADEIITLARSRLRSRNVPAADWRYEYCRIR
jgi:hypothetical protein